MSLREELRAAFEQHCYWDAPRSVGVARVYYVERMHWHPRPEDLVSLALGSLEQDLTAYEGVYGVPGEWNIQKGNVVEVIVRTPYPLLYGRLGGPSECLVAVRQFRPATYGIIEPDDESHLALMFGHFNNRRMLWDSRAFFRTFLGANIAPIPPEDVMYS